MKRKEIRYLEPASEVEELVWKRNFCPVEIGCREFVATQSTRLLKDFDLALLRASRKYQLQRARKSSI